MGSSKSNSNPCKMLTGDKYSQHTLEGGYLLGTWQVECRYSSVTSCDRGKSIPSHCSAVRKASKGACQESKCKSATKSTYFGNGQTTNCITISGAGVVAGAGLASIRVDGNTTRVGVRVGVNNVASDVGVSSSSDVSGAGVSDVSDAGVSDGRVNGTGVSGTVVSEVDTADPETADTVPAAKASSPAAVGNLRAAPAEVKATTAAVATAVAEKREEEEGVEKEGQVQMQEQEQQKRVGEGEKE
jgi:hypothetical protein